MKHQEQKTILLVEDDTVTTMVETHLLKSFGYDVVAAKSGEEAVQIATGNDKIALVLMDINLGSGIDGTEAARQILGKRHLPIVFLTSHTEKEYVERVKAITRYGYVLKNSVKFVIQSSIEMAFNLFKAQEAMRESEKKYRALVENINDIVFTVDIQGLLTYMSPVIEGIIGYTPEEMIGQSFSRFVFQDDLPMLMARFQMLLAGEIQPSDYRIVTRTGDIRWVRSSSRPVIVDGKAVAIHGLISDITESKRAAEMLRESNANFRAFFESITDMIIVGTPDGRLLFTNAAITRTLGYTPDELKGMRLLDLHPADKRREAEEIFAAMLKCERESCPLPLARKDGGLVPVETRVWFGQWSGVDCIFGISKNLTAEQEAQQRFEQLFHNNLALMVLSTVPDQRFSDVNDAFLKTLGYSRGDIIGKTVAELGLFPHAKQQAAIADKLQADGHIADFELQVRHKDGAILDGLFSGDVIESQGRQYFLTVMHNITERKRMEKEIIKISTLEKQGMARDLHDGVAQQLAGAVYLCHVLRDQLTSASQKKAAEEIDVVLHQCLQHVRNVANMLLPVGLEDAGLVAALQHLAGIISKMFPVNCRLEQSGDPVAFDPKTSTHLYYLVQEAVMNAARHGSPHNIVISFSYRLEQLTVQDDGSGFDLLQAGKGGGMGLQIMRYRADIIGGVLAIDSRKGGGTRIQCKFVRSAGT